MKSSKPTKEEFVLYREQLVRDYQNNLNSTPLKQGGELLSTILYKEYAGDYKKQKALKKLSFAETSRFCDKVLSSCFIESMLYGNQTREEGEKIWESMQTILNFKPYPKALHPMIEIAELPSRESATLLVLESEQPANALILTTDCGFFSFKNAAALEVLAKAFEEPFFSELRTRQQTAYVVGNWSQELERHLYAFFAIQSSSHDSRDLLSRFELFLENTLQHAKESYLTKERFESIKTSILYKHKHPAENLAKMGTLLFTLGNDYDGDFDWLNKRIEALNNLTYDEFLELSHQWFGKNNSRRLAICVNGKLPAKGVVSYQNYTTEEKIKKEISYKDKSSIN